MIPFALRLTLRGGREALIRLVLLGVAVAIGAGLLLTTLAGINAVNEQNSRYAWLNSGRESNVDSSGSLWWSAQGDYFDGQLLGRIDVAPAGPDAPTPPGMAHLPRPGEYYVSPALAKLLDSTPRDQLGDRFPGHLAGVLDSSALPSPDFLIVVIGHTPEEMASLDGAVRVNHIEAHSPDDCIDCVVGIRSSAMDLVLGVVALAMLFPVLMFIGTATRLSAARREQRFAAMRLVGATPKQIAVIATVESTVAAIAGTIVGFGLFALFRKPVAAIPFTGIPFFPSDLSLTFVDVLIVALGIPLGAAIAARIGLRRVRISPLGVTRRVTPTSPRAWRLIPMLIGLAELAYFIGHRPMTGMGQLWAFLPAMLIIMGGLVFAGPWLTMAGSRMLARHASRPASLIATRRLSDNPHAAFRAVSGLMLALFITSVAVGIITTITAYRGGPVQGPATEASLNKNGIGKTGVPDSLVGQLRAMDGVKALILVHQSPDSFDAYVSCADLAQAQAFGHCAPGTEVANGYIDLIGPGGPVRPDQVVLPDSGLTLRQLQQLPVTSLVVLTDGSRAAIERARTWIELAYPHDLRRLPTTDADYAANTTGALAGWTQLANVAILTSLPIAGCSLAVSIAGGLSERKRPFSLLRLSGVPVRLLRRVVLLESAVPLLASAALAIAMGFLAAHLFLVAQMHYNLLAPGVSYYVIVAVGLLASLAIIGSTLPLLERITGPETARSE